MKNKNKAFSLIELSIVILIIGILIAGITSGSRLVNASKLQTAQTITQSSPVASIRGLVLWLETSMDDSFRTGENADDTSITQWNDRNPQSVYKFFARPAAASTDIRFRSADTAGINSLPSLLFAGTSTANGFLTLSTTAQGTTIAPTAITTPNNNFTFFVVSKTTTADVSAASRAVFYNGTAGTNGYGYMIGNNAGSSFSVRNMLFGDGSAAVDNLGGTIGTSAAVITGTYAGGTNGTNLFVNGGVINSGTSGVTSSATSANPTTGLYIGAKTSAGANLWRGYISEIILFDSVLKLSDRQSVEQYLGKKYNIKIVQ